MQGTDGLQALPPFPRHTKVLPVNSSHWDPQRTARGRRTTLDICHGPQRCRVVVPWPRKYLRLAGSRTAGFTVHLCLFLGALQKPPRGPCPGRALLQGTAWLPPSNTTHRPHTLEGRGHRRAWQWPPHPLPGHTQCTSTRALAPSLQPAGLATVPCFGPGGRLQFCHLGAFTGALRARGTFPGCLGAKAFLLELGAGLGGRGLPAGDGAPGAFASGWRLRGFEALQGQKLTVTVTAVGGSEVFQQGRATAVLQALVPGNREGNSPGQNLPL